jgi:hypothetical protein
MNFGQLFATTVERYLYDLQVPNIYLHPKFVLSGGGGWQVEHYYSFGIQLFASGKKSLGSWNLLSSSNLSKIEAVLIRDKSISVKIAHKNSEENVWSFWLKNQERQFIGDKTM